MIFIFQCANLQTRGRIHASFPRSIDISTPKIVSLVRAIFGSKRNSQYATHVQILEEDPFLLSCREMVSPVLHTRASNNDSRREAVGMTSQACSCAPDSRCRICLPYNAPSKSRETSIAIACVNIDIREAFIKVDLLSTSI